jgi:hypothetical protein
VNLEDMYKHFGPAVLHEIRSHTAMSGGSLTDLLKRLNIPSGPSVESQHVALRNFIYSYGVSFFLSAVQSNFDKEDIERMKAKRLMQLSRQERRAGSKVFQSAEEMKKDLQAEHSGQVAPSTLQAGPPPQGTPLRRKSDEVWQQQQQPAPAPAVPPGTKMVDSKLYNGPERRNGVERRVTQRERRQDLQVVFKNRRYGGDRRKTVRRREDREKAMKKGN